MKLCHVNDDIPGAPAAHDECAFAAQSVTRLADQLVSIGKGKEVLTDAQGLQVLTP